MRCSGAGDAIIMLKGETLEQVLKFCYSIIIDVNSGAFIKGEVSHRQNENV